MSLKVETKDLTAGSSYEYKEKVEFIGDIPNGVSIIVKNGDAIFHGSLGENVDVKTSFKGNSSGSVTIINSGRGLSLGGGSITITGNTGGKVIVNGQDMTEKLNDGNGCGDILVKGTVARSCTLDAAATVTVEQHIADDVTIDSENSTNIQTAGNGLQIDSGNSTNFEKTGSDATIFAGNSINGKFLGAESKVRAGNSVKVDIIADKCLVRAGNSIKGSQSGTDVSLRAGNKTKITNQNQSIPGGAVKKSDDIDAGEVIKSFVKNVTKDFKR